MKKVNLPMIITSVLVQSYITVSRAWAIGDKMYKNMKEIKAINPSAATIAAPKTA